MITLTSDQSTFATRGSPRRVRSLARPLPLSPDVSLFFFLFAAANSPPCVAARVLPRDEAPSFYFRVQDALVCYLSSTLTSLLAAIILINISPIGGRREESLHPIPRWLLRLFSLADSLGLVSRGRKRRGWEITREQPRERERKNERERKRETIGELYDASRVVFASAAWLAITVSSSSTIYRAAACHAGLSLLRFSLLLLSLPSAAPPSGEEEPEILRPVYSEIERGRRKGEEALPGPTSNCICSRV